MLAPLTALSLASSIAQLVEFAKDVIRDGHQIARNGSTSGNGQIDLIAKDMKTLSERVVEEYDVNSSDQSRDPDQTLQRLGQASCEVSAELIDLLAKLQIKGPSAVKMGKRNVLSLSLRSMLKKEDVQKLQQRLQSLQQQLHLRLTHIMYSERYVLRLRRMVLYSLTFPEINDREDAVTENYKSTFSWAFDANTTTFSTWAREGSGLFWVTGKPGSGKSTLMKYLSNHSHTSDLLRHWAGDDKLVIAKHYFWIVGTATQKSQSGLLRSLLYQIFEACPEITPIVSPHRILNETGVERVWTMPELKETMRRIADLQNLSLRFCLFVDGLDEYDGEHEEVVDLLSDLARSSRVKICYSSRPWNVFINFWDRKHRILVQDLTRQDILTYVAGNLQADSRYQQIEQQSTDGADLIQEIAIRSEGVFLWVFLVVRSLLRGLNNADDLDILRKRVAEYPDSLDGYFRRMFNSTEKVYREEMGRILLAAIHSNSSLPLGLLDGLNTEKKNPDYDIWLPLQQSERNQREREREICRVAMLLDARCRDLLEVVRDQIQFLHRTVRDFLATSDVHALLFKRAGASFDPVSSLAKLTLAEIKTGNENSADRLTALYEYERRTAQKIRPPYINFIQQLSAPTMLSSLSNDTYLKIEHKFVFHADEGPPSHGSSGTGVFTAAEEMDRFLDVSNTKDWLIVVRDDYVVVIGDRGDVGTISNLQIEEHAWIGLKSAYLTNRIVLVRARHHRSDEKTELYALIARFQIREHGLHERQRAFIRLAQAIFAIPSALIALKAASNIPSP